MGLFTNTVPLGSVKSTGPEVAWRGGGCEGIIIGLKILCILLGKVLSL